MTANHRAQSQLMTMCVINKYIEDHGHAPRLVELARLRNMDVKNVRLHMMYLERNGYLIHVGRSWQKIWITEKGMVAA